MDTWDQPLQKQATQAAAAVKPAVEMPADAKVAMMTHQATTVNTAGVPDLQALHTLMSLPLERGRDPITTLISMIINATSIQPMKTTIKYVSILLMLYKQKQDVLTPDLFRLGSQWG